jgi:hypothetical protein
MSDTNLYANQFKKKPIVGNSVLGINPNPYQMDVTFDPSATGLTLQAGEGVVLKDLGSDDMAAAGIPVVAKRDHNYDAVYGVRIYSILKALPGPGDNVVIAMKGDVINFKASGAISRGAKVSLILASPGYVKTVAAGYAEVGVALDKAADGDIIRVELTCDNTAVAET